MTEEQKSELIDATELVEALSLDQRANQAAARISKIVAAHGLDAPIPLVDSIASGLEKIADFIDYMDADRKSMENEIINLRKRLGV